MRKVPNKNCYRVTNKRTKKVMAKCATQENAKKQLKLLRAIQNNKSFVPNNRRTMKASK
jgi:NADH:ubiquinone oxidoreductase subunit E